MTNQLVPAALSQPGFARALIGRNRDPESRAAVHLLVGLGGALRSREGAK